jgi:hypothetical protein
MAHGLHIWNRTETSCNCFKWEGRGLRRRDDGGDVTDAEYKLNQNGHYESPLYNEHILIKIFLE